MTPTQAEALGIRALKFLASDGERLGYFLAVTGTNPADLRERADNSELLAAILDHLLADEHLLVQFCKAEGADPREPGRARRALPGYMEPM